MSDVLRSNDASNGRALRPEEVALLSRILGSERANCLSDATVVDMNDGGMGSVRFAPFGDARRYGSTLADAQFTDADGIPVSVTVNVDQHGQLLELDLWKVDFSPLLRYPGPAEVTLQPRPGAGSAHVHLPHPA